MAKVLIKTSEGDIKVRLYDETPQHRDNFLKLAKEGYFDGTLFHRVIKDFMIQGGDPDSRFAFMASIVASSRIWMAPRLMASCSSSSPKALPGSLKSEMLNS